jgi:L-asparaginase
MHVCLVAVALASAALAVTGISTAHAQTQSNAAKKSVRVLATGGTIAGAGQASGSSYKAGVVPIGDILRAVPGLNDIANVSAEQVANVGSYDVDEALWLRILERVRTALASSEISGVVITHGTNTLEETAYFLNLVLPSSKPVVLVGSMRPGTSVSADGPQNLQDAVRVASADISRGHGVMVVMNDTIFEPTSVTKMDNRRVNAFEAPSRGPIGQVLTEQPTFFAAGIAQDSAFSITTETLPRVTIAYAYAGVSGDDIRAAAQRAKGLIIAGTGTGDFSASARRAVQELTSNGFPVVRTARQGIGDVWVNDPSMGDLSDEALGTIAGRELTPAKARILLMLSLQRPRSRDELQSLFDKYGTNGR